MKNGQVYKGKKGTLTGESISISSNQAQKTFPLTDVTLVQAKEGKAGKWALAMGGGCLGVGIIVSVTQGGKYNEVSGETYDTGTLLLGSFLWAGIFEGAILAVIVVFLFLRNWRATFLAAMALPLSIIPTFLAMDWLGYSLNTVTLLALSLVVGILVDDAIVEVENIERHLDMGKTPYDAAMEASDEIGLAVIATTFSLVAVFLPTAFMAGIPGIIFKQFGITASVAVLCSLLVARLITPMMAAYMLKPSGPAPKWRMAGSCAIT